MKYYLIKLLTNTQGQDGSSVNVFDTKESALVAYHQTLANFHNADDVLYAVVEVQDENGNITDKEIVDHRPEPEPEPEPTPEETVDVTEE